MARPRWSLEIELDEAVLALPAAGARLAVSGPGLRQTGRLLRAWVAGGRPEGAAAALDHAGAPLLLHLEEGAPPEHPALRVASDAAALWWEEDPAGAAELELLRARCLLAALEPAAAARALRPWARRDGLPLLLRARLMERAALAAAEAGLLVEAVADLDEALSALERRPRACAEGEALRCAVAALRAQLWLEGGQRTDRAELALLAALGPPEGWLLLPEQAHAAEGELSLLRWALSGAAAPDLRQALVKRHARWAPRGGGLAERRALLLRGLLLEEEGLPREAASAWARAAAGVGPAPPRVALVALAAERFGAGLGGGFLGRAEALDKRCPGAAPHTAALRRPDPAGPRRARLHDLPAGLR